MPKMLKSVKKRDHPSPAGGAPLPKKNPLFSQGDDAVGDDQSLDSARRKVFPRVEKFLN